MFSPPFVKIVAPSAPTNVSATATSQTSLKVKWNSVIDSNAKGYAIWYRKTYDALQNWHIVALTLQYNEWKLINLEKYTMYTLRVNAFYSTGNGLASKSYDARTLEGGKSVQFPLVMLYIFLSS